MKKFTLISSLLILTLFCAPVSSFAKDNNENYRDTDHMSSLFSRISGIFDHRVHAESTPSISGITAPTVLKIGEEGTWKVNASDSDNRALTYAVDWGDTNMIARMIARPSFVQTSTFTHTYDKAGTYTVTFTVTNDAGAKTTSSATVRVTSADSTTNAPAISNVVATTKDARHATIAWSTDVRGNSRVWYGTASPVDTTGNAQVSRIGRTTNHRLNLNNLTPSTTYYVVVGSANGNGMTKSSEISFTTPAAAERAPVIISIKGDTNIKAGDTEHITVVAYDPASRALTYSMDWGDSANAARMSEERFKQTATFDHVYNTAGTYTATFTVQNDIGLKASKSLTIVVGSGTTDTTNPVISTISVTANPNAATISWNTDEDASSQIYYSKSTPINTSSDTSVSNDALVQTHAMDLKDLAASTRYYFIVRSTDGSGNTTNSDESSFMTPDVL